MKLIAAGVALLVMGIIFFAGDGAWLSGVLFVAFGLLVLYVARLAWRGEFWKPPREP